MGSNGGQHARADGALPDALLVQHLPFSVRRAVSQVYRSRGMAVRGASSSLSREKRMVGTNLVDASNAVVVVALSHRFDVAVVVVVAMLLLCC